MTDVSDEYITNQAMNQLKDEKSIRGTMSQILDKKVTKVVLEASDVNIQEMSMEDFNKMVYAADTVETEEVDKVADETEEVTDEIIETEEKIEEEAVVELKEESEESN